MPMLRSTRIVAAVVGLVAGLLLVPSALLSEKGGINNLNLPPSSATVGVGQTFQFTAKVTPSGSSVTWNVNGVLGGNATVGTIATTGMYTAPAAVPSPASVTVTVASVVNPAKSAIATVTLFPAGVVS